VSSDKSTALEPSADGPEAGDPAAASPAEALPEVQQDAPQTLQDVFEEHTGRYIAKIDSFFDVYEKHLAPWRGREFKLLEIGVDRGGSLEIWRKYFGRDCDIHGIDIRPRIFRRIRKTKIHIGSQDDAGFLAQVVNDHGPFDVIIDDGSHQFEHQIRSFETLYPTMPDDGVYICEDAFTSYWREYGGGVGRDTFIEYAKRLVDDLHAFWAGDDALEVLPFTRSTRGVHFYSGTVVFERGPAAEPRYIGRGRHTTQELSMAQLKASAARDSKHLDS